MGMMNLTSVEMMIDPWSEGRGVSREKRDTPDTIRVTPGSKRSRATPASSEMEYSPMKTPSSNLASFTSRENDPLCVLAYAGRLVDGGADYCV